MKKNGNDSATIIVIGIAAALLLIIAFLVF